MRFWKLYLTKGEQGLEVFLGGLPGVEAGWVQIGRFYGQQRLTGFQVLLGFGQSLAHKGLFHLFRRPHKSPFRTCLPDMQCRR